MKTIRLLVFIILSSVILNASVSPIFAKAPITPKILFTSTRDGNRDVYVMNPDGSEQVNLTQHRSDDQQAVWSPTGEQILFISDRSGKRDLYLMDPNGTNIRRVFKRKTKVHRYSPTWSPDGKHIAYEQMGTANSTYTIYIATLGGQQVERLADGTLPTWSPNGLEIACTVDGQIILINTHTRAKKRLLPKKAMNWQREPSWSAVGDKLVFSSNKNPLPPDHELGEPISVVWMAKETIYMINRDGTNIQQLIDGDGHRVADPVLSPKGNELLYTQEIKGQNQVFKLDINTGVRTQLTHIGFSRLSNFGGDWFDPAYALPVSSQP